MPRSRSRRLRLALAAVSLMVCGLTVHALGGAVAGFTGDAVYATFIAVLLALVLPASRSRLAPVAALAVCTAIEVWQLTPIPGDLSQSVPGASLVVGSTFSWFDLLAYALGAVLAVPIEAWSRGRAHRSRSTAVAATDER